MKFKLTGVAPLIMHDIKTLDPLHPLVKERKPIAKKRIKTDEDYLALYRLDWFAGLYHSLELGPYIPAQNLERMIQDAGKIQKLGTLIKQSVQVLDDAKLIYNGPRDPEELFKRPAFSYITGVRIGQQRIMTNRPIFREWELVFDASVDESIMDERQLDSVMFDAGKRIGLCDYRPRFGRFTAERVA